MNQFLAFAVSLARHTGNQIKKAFLLPHKIEYKSIKNPVTDIDKKIDAFCANEIQRKYPSHAILSEELHNQTHSQHKFLWVIDPIDGTLNFIHRIPFVAVSIALLIDEKLALGIVYNPILDELFTAVRDKGAFLNNKKIHASSITNISRALLATGMQPIFGKKEIKIYEKFCQAAQAVRRLGSASIDLCYIANGKLDGCFEIGLKPWDIAAGILILQEAGGKVSGFNGKPLDFLRDGDILASNGKIHSQMLKTAVK